MEKNKPKYHCYIIGLSDGSIGFILGLLEQYSNVKILCLEERSEKEIFLENDKYEIETTIQNKCNNLKKLFFKKNNFKELPHDIIGSRRDFKNTSPVYTYENVKNTIRKLKTSFQFKNDDTDDYFYNQLDFEHIGQHNIYKSKNEKLFATKRLQQILFDKRIDILYNQKVTRIVFDEMNNANQLIIKTLTTSYILDINNDLFISAGTLETPKLLTASGICNDGEIVNNHNVGKNIVSRPYIENYYKYERTNFFVIPFMEYYFQHFYKFYIFQFFFSFLTSIFYLILFTQILPFPTYIKVVCFILLSFIDSLMTFVTRRSNAIFLGYFTGFFISLILSVFILNTYTWNWVHFLIYWNSYYIFYVLLHWIYKKYNKSFLSAINGRDIYTIQHIYTIYFMDQHKEHFIRLFVYFQILFLFQILFYSFVNLFLYLFFVYWWIYDDVFVVRVRLRNTKSLGSYKMINKEWVLDLNLFQYKNEIYKLLYGLRNGEKMVLDLFEFKKYEHHNNSLSKKWNYNFIKRRVLLGGELSGSCKLGTNKKNGVVDRNTLKVFGTKNLYILGSSVFGGDNPIISTCIGHIRAYLIKM